MDGFRFDLASVMCRDGKGNPLDAPPIVRAIAKDPVLSQARCIHTFSLSEKTFNQSKP